jgi:prophage regulatory protein
MQTVVLLGVSEIRVRLGGVSRQRVDQLTRRSHFPPPYAELAQGRVWIASAVDAWIREHRVDLSAGSEN